MRAAFYPIDIGLLPFYVYKDKKKELLPEQYSIWICEYRTKTQYSLDQQHDLLFKTQDI